MISESHPNTGGFAQSESGLSARSGLTRREQHRVILNGDVVGYSRLMAADPHATVRALLASLGRIERLVRAHHGHLLDAVGDNFMAQFPTEPHAVRCAMEVQHRPRRAKTTQATALPIDWRLGICSGVVIEHAGRAYGNALNLAARLQAHAPESGMMLALPVAERCEGQLADLSWELHTVKRKDSAPQLAVAVATRS